MSGTATRRVTPIELLDMRSQRWRKRIEVVSLAAEVLDVIPVARREQALTALGILYQKSRDRPDLLRRWPAVHVIATAGVAADNYEHGTYWPRLLEMLGVEGHPGFQHEWGQAFLDNLHRLHLPTFDSGSEDAGSKFVGRILMHAGVPTFCLRDYYRLIRSGRTRFPGLEPAEFVSWAASRASRNQLHNVDKPVARFLQYGGDFAVDVTDRIYDLLDALAAGGDGTDVPLPERFRLVAQEMRDDGEIVHARSRTSRAGQGEIDQRPRLALDPFGQGLLLRLPAVGEAPDGSAVWIVNLDETTRHIPTSLFLPEFGEPAPPTDVPIPAPVRTASVAMAGREDLTTTLPVVDDADPLLAFAEDGLLVQPGLPLPGRPTWLLFAGVPDDVRIVGNAPVLSESPLPPGWAGWCLVLVDLDSVSSVAVGDAGRSRSVRSKAAARVVADDPVHGVRSATRLPVFAARPTVHLPEQLGDADWTVTLLDAVGEVLSQWHSADGGSPDSVWQDLPRPTVGTFTVRVRGPWGRGTTRTLTVVEGLDVSFSPTWRCFKAKGLEHATARVLAARGVLVAPEVIEYSAQVRENRVRVSAHGEHRTLVVTPPHMTVAYQTKQMTTNPSIQPVQLLSEDVTAQRGTLILDIGADAEPRLHVILGSRQIQVVEPAGGRAGVYHFDLAKIVDTLAVHPQVRLALDADAALVVASVRPRRLHRGVAIAGAELVFTDCVDVDGLTALVYPTRAPWRDPAVLPIADGRVILPDWLTNAGPLRVLVRLDDPWAPLPIPEWPDMAESVLVEASGYVAEDDDQEATALSAFLAGAGTMPMITDFTRLWTVRALLRDLPTGQRADPIKAALDSRIRTSVRDSLLAVAPSKAPIEAIPELLISTGLVWANLSTAHDDTTTRWSVRGALSTALLSAADGEWSAEEVEAAVETCGDVVAELLAGNDRHAAAGRLDQAATLFDQNPAMREDFVRQAALVPTGLLSADSRVIAAMEYVKQRKNSRIAPLARRPMLDDVSLMLRILGDPVADEAFAEHGPGTSASGWQTVPALSRAFAFLARHAARGHRAVAEWLPQHRRTWAHLAAVAPQMVTIDLIVAELLVASTFNEKQESHA
ncbi:hypothetical protein [Pseudonocardia sp. MH-G8]|uniref:hypothetical protein n=1 Tax=Pseudonocardia sp. MH-G8 TaxID=1854588 RepID=UPI0018E9AA2D|nr:hypothetical protein [Pseudonocardia sp. MH-G8]